MIFTFDGDAAGQKAALRAFGGDQNFVAQTFVAVEPTGLDPCDLRLQQGDAAVRELVARRRPLYQFVLEQRRRPSTTSTAPRAGSTPYARRRRLVSSIRDKSKVEAFARELAGMVGVDVEQARTEVRRGRGARPARLRSATGRPARRRAPARAPAPPPLPDLRDPRFALEREALKLVVQEPEARGPGDRATSAPTTSPTRRTAPSGSWSSSAAGLGAADAGWAARLPAPRPTRRSPRRCPALAVEPLPSRKGADDAFVANTVYRLQELTAQRRIAEREVAAPAHQPGRAHRRVQPDVRRADRPRAAPPPAARPGAGRPMSGR